MTLTRLYRVNFYPKNVNPRDMPVVYEYSDSMDALYRVLNLLEDFGPCLIQIVNKHDAIVTFNVYTCELDKLIPAFGL